MAKKATSGGSRAKSNSKGSATGTSVARRASSGGSRSNSNEGMGDAFIKLLQSPLVADLLAVAATAALAALAEHGFSSSGAGENARSKRAGKAVKEAGKAAAAAIGRRLANEMEEIRAASKTSKGGAKA